MAERRPLVVIDGQMQELPSADTLPGAGGGTADYPDFTGNAGKHLGVNQTEDGVEWVDPPSGGSAMTGEEIQTVLDAYYGGTGWRTDTDTHPTAQEIQDALDAFYGNTDWRTPGSGGVMTGEDIETALDSYYGNTDWRTGGSGGGGGPAEVSMETQALTVVNGDFETGDLTGWTSVGGVPLAESVASGTGAWDEELNYETLGTYALTGGTQASSEVYQDVTLPAGTFYLSMNFTLGQNDVSAEDSVSIIFEFYDETDTLLSSASEILASPNSGIVVYENHQVFAAVGSAYVRIRVVFGRGSVGSYINAMADNISGSAVVLLTSDKNYFLTHEFYQTATTITGTSVEMASKGVLLEVTQTQVVISVGTYFPAADQTVVFQVFEVDTVESPSTVQSLIFQSDPFVTAVETMTIPTSGLILEAGKSYFCAWSLASGGGTQALNTAYSASNPNTASWVSGRNGGRIALDATGNFIGQDVYYDPNDHYRVDFLSYSEASRSIIAGGVAGPQGAQGPQGPVGPQGDPGENGADGANNFLVFSSAFPNETATTSFSSSAYATKGNIVTMNQSRLLLEVESYLEAGQTVSLVVAQLSEVNPGTITNVLYTSTPKAVSGITVFELDTPLQLDQGSVYALLFVRTDGTAGTAMAVPFPGGTPWSDPDGNFVIGGAVRYASVAPQVSDTVFYSSSTSVRMIITTTSTENGQLILDHKIDLEEDVAADHAVSNADLAGNKFLKMNLATAQTVTVTAGLTGLEPMTVIQQGEGQVTFVADTGVTIDSADGLLALRTQFSSAVLIPDGTDHYFLIGDLV